jgi:hypothetical protein
MKWRMWGAFWMSVTLILLHLSNIGCLLIENHSWPYRFVGVAFSTFGATIAGWGFYNSVNALYRMKSRRNP